MEGLVSSIRAVAAATKFASGLYPARFEPGTCHFDETADTTLAALLATRDTAREAAREGATDPGPWLL